MESLDVKFEEPFVSILTPMYNGEKYLAECIESVLNQSYENWEYVIVNNCSTDDSLDIAQKYAEKDSRIRIHNNEHFLPQMENLNHSFRQISPESKYCKVVHADDILFPECVSKMVALAEEYPSIGVVSSYQINGKKLAAKGLFFPERFGSGKEFAKRYLLEEIKCVALPSAILIRSDLVRKRDEMYDETNLQSDAAAFLDILNESDFGFLHQILTVTRIHGDSVTSQIEELYLHMLGLLRIYLEYAPVFLSGVEAKQVIERRERIFYILFARSLVLENAKEVYSRAVKELKSADLPVKHVKLLRYLIRETLLQLIRKIRFRK